MKIDNDPLFVTKGSLDAPMDAFIIHKGIWANDQWAKATCRPFLMKIGATVQYLHEFENIYFYSHKFLNMRWASLTYKLNFQPVQPYVP